MAEAVLIPPFQLEGSLDYPKRPAVGLVLFAHGSGSSRFSPRNTYVAAALRDAGLATLLFDLLNEAEAENRANVFDIGLLAERLVSASEWVGKAAKARSLPLGYFGASTGAAAALVGAAKLSSRVGAVVSRGGRPDLAGEALSRVKAPTLLIVGGDDREVLALNQEARRSLRCESAIKIVPNATHLFEEPGALDTVVDLARSWFLAHLGPKRNDRS
jgi:putative phosphoribosyl transferase